MTESGMNDDGLLLSQICSILHDFLMPPTIAIYEEIELDRVWLSDFGWHFQ
jgi:hypothetical protein